MIAFRSVPLPVLWVALFVPLCGTLCYFVLFEGGALPQILFMGTKAFNWICPLLFLKWTGTRGLWNPVEGRGEVMSRRKTLGEGIGLGVVISLLALALMAWTPMGGIIEEGSGQVSDKLISLGVKESYLWFALFISFGNSAMEEYYWRWFLYGNFRHHLKRGTAHLVAAVGFSLHHIVVTLCFFRWELALFLSLCVGVGGALWSWLYERHGTVLGAWVCHILIDLVIMWIGYEIVFG